jgi:hypothetical protein
MYGLIGALLLFGIRVQVLELTYTPLNIGCIGFCNSKSVFSHNPTCSNYLKKCWFLLLQIYGIFPAPSNNVLPCLLRYLRMSGVKQLSVIMDKKAGMWTHNS